MSEPFLGEIKIVGFNFPPRGYAKCDGQTLPISQNSALFSLLGTTFGGDGRTTFKLPDLRGRAALHVGQGPGLSNCQWGQQGGSETNTLGVGQIPAHTHSFAVPAVSGGTGGEEPNPGNSLGEASIYSSSPPDETLRPGTTGSAGSSQPINNMQPFLCVYHVIALTGLFPSRS